MNCRSDVDVVSEAATVRPSRNTCGVLYDCGVHLPLAQMLTPRTSPERVAPSESQFLIATVIAVKPRFENIFGRLHIVRFHCFLPVFEILRFRTLCVPRYRAFSSL